MPAQAIAMMLIEELNTASPSWTMRLASTKARLWASGHRGVSRSGRRAVREPHLRFERARRVVLRQPVDSLFGRVAEGQTGIDSRVQVPAERLVAFGELPDYPYQCLASPCLEIGRTGRIAGVGQARITFNRRSLQSQAGADDVFHRLLQSRTRHPVEQEQAGIPRRISEMPLPAGRIATVDLDDAGRTALRLPVRQCPRRFWRPERLKSAHVESSEGQTDARPRVEPIHP